jgi:hypothetical protein
MTTKKTRWCYFEEYKHCSCSFVALKRSELLGYCQVHGNDYRHRMKLPYTKGDQLGYARG